MVYFILILLMHIFEAIFFIGIAGALVTVLMSWYSIFKDEFTSQK